MRRPSSKGDETLVERVHFISRVTEDPRTPIPEKEAGGWNDMATHRAVGLGLHRFGGDLERLKKMKPEIEQAKQLKVPYFILLESEKHATPETVKGIFELDPDCPALEIVNEPNLRMKPEQYVEILKTCREAAKAINPKTLILGPSQCGTALGWFESFFKAGGGELVDGVSVHTYMRHNSMDATHWLWKLKRLREVMAAQGCGEKPRYMTEHGFLGDYHEIIIRPQWQARSLFLEYMVTDRFGMWPNRYFYYYLNFGGYAGFSSFIVNQRRELFPAATLLRVRAQMLEDRAYARALEFGSPGDGLVLGNIYEGKEKDLLILQNTGALRPVTVALNLSAGAEAFDAFGNKLELTRAGELARLEIGRVPSYVRFTHGHALQGTLPEFPAELKNVAPNAKVVVDDEEAAPKVAFLTNGALEFDFDDEPERVGFRAQAEHLPLDVDLTFEKPRTLSAAILYGSFADNDKCTPLAYEVLLKIGGAWKKVDAVDVSADGRATKLEPFVKRVSGYDDPWIFVHRFEPTAAEAVRFHFTRTTFGQWPNEAVKISNLQPRAHLREIQLFGAADEERKTGKAETK
ncbi:MAG: hypothetical protein HY291_09960 [Planctomycetes bacterium]|nr:hypothetical protein [Planctomycetota bacterium]